MDKDVIRHAMPDFYAASLFAAQDKRAHLYHLFQFYLEISKIPETVSEPLLGEIRLQWWRDSLQALKKGTLSGHPVADNFAQTVRELSLPELHIANLIDARSFDVSGEDMPDWQAFKVYLVKTFGSLFFLSACVLDASYKLSSNTKEVYDAKKMQDVAQAAGLAYGITEILRSLPLQASKGKLFLPLSYLADHNVNLEDVLCGQHSANLLAVIQSLKGEAERSKRDVQDMLADLPARLLPALLPVSLTPIFLKKIAHQDHKPLHHIVQISPIHRLFRYWYTSAFSKI